jgi:two-component system NtrC family sensor kinase
VAHELNNPLSVVIGRALMLEEDIKEPAQIEQVRKLRAAAERCVKISKTFLAMARQNAPKRAPMSLNQAVETALDLTSYSLNTSGIEVRLKLAPDLPDVVADEDQIIQVFVNVIVNAQQALADVDWKRKISIKTFYDSAACEIVCKLTDNGPGVPPHILPRIFEPFFTTKEVGRGTGVGLAVSLGMIEAHNGSMSAASRPGAGATFRIALPVAPADEEARASPHAAGPAQVSDPRTRLLVIDDEPEVGAMLAEMLGRLGNRVVTEIGAGAALDRLQREEMDAILCDLRMPEMDGPGFYHELKSRNRKLSQRVIFVSGDALSLSPEQRQALDGRPVL